MKFFCLVCEVMLSLDQTTTVLGLVKVNKWYKDVKLVISGMCPRVTGGDTNLCFLVVGELRF